MKVNTPRLAALAGCLCAIIACAAAHKASAQLPFLGGPSAIDAGIFLPTSGAAKTKGGSTQLSLDARFALPSVPLTPTRTVLGVGVETGAHDGMHSTVVPVTIAEYVGNGNLSPLKPSVPYFGIGIGPYFENQSGLSVSTKLGGFAAVGYNFSLVFLEAKYQLVTNADGFTVNLGMRF